MIIRFKTHVNKNGNSYGLIVDTEKKLYKAGFSICAWNVDFYATKKDIEQFITYNLKTNGFKPADEI